MRRCVYLATILALTAASAARADDKADAKALIVKAIKAAGGEEKLNKFKAETFKGKGKFYGMGEGLDYTGEWAVQRPDRFRVKIESKAGDQTFTFIRVINGDKIWMKLGADVQEVKDKDELAEAREEMHIGQVQSLAPLMGKDYEFTLLGEIKVEGKPAVGIRVSHKGRRDVNLYFDKDASLLVKSEAVVKDPMAGKEVTQESIYSDYKEVQGVQRAWKVVINRDGKRYVDGEVTEIELHEKLDDAAFSKP
jgi:hypothetical protein